MFRLPLPIRTMYPYPLSANVKGFKSSVEMSQAVKKRKKKEKGFGGTIEYGGSETK